MFPIVKNGEAYYYQIGVVSYGIGKIIKHFISIPLIDHARLTLIDNYLHIVSNAFIA